MELLFLFALWLGLALLARWIATEKGRNGEGFFLLGALCPLIGLVAAACARPDAAALAARDKANAAAKPSKKSYSAADYRRAAALRVNS